MRNAEGAPLDRRAAGEIISKITPNELTGWLQRQGATSIEGPNGSIGAVLPLPTKEARVVLPDPKVGAVSYPPLERSLVITEEPHQAVVVEPATALGLSANFRGHGKMKVPYKTSEEFVTNLPFDHDVLPVEIIADNPGNPEYRPPFQRVVTEAVLHIRQPRKA